MDAERHLFDDLVAPGDAQRAVITAVAVLPDMTAQPVDVRQFDTLSDPTDDAVAVPVDFTAKSGRLIRCSTAVTM